MTAGPVAMPAAGPPGGSYDGGDRGLSTLHRLIRRLNADLDLQATLTAVVQGVVDDLGFAVAVVNLVRPDGDLEVVAVAGIDDGVRQLHGQVGPRADWDALLAVAEPIGGLRFIDHRKAAGQPQDGIPFWVPDIAESDEVDAWHAQDELLAPLRECPAGRRVGPARWSCESRSTSRGWSSPATTWPRRSPNCSARTTCPPPH